MASSVESDRSPMLTATPSRAIPQPATVTPPPPPMELRAAVARPGRVPPTREQLERRRVASTRIFCGAAIALVLSTFLPWASVLSIVSVHLSGGEVVYLLLFAGIYAGEARLVHNQRVTRSLMIGSWLVNAWMVVNLLVLFNALGQGEGLVSPGAGLYIASVGVIAAIVATVQLHRSRGHAAASASTDGAHLLPDERP